MVRQIVQIQFRRRSSVQWLDDDPVLGAGEPGEELDTGNFKLGNGFSPWSQLDYFIPTGKIAELIQEMIDAGPGGGVDGWEDALADHIGSLNPHPAWDNGPSLVLLYENVKAG